MEISIAKDFSITPGFRYITEGPDSGEEFRQKILEPLFQNKDTQYPITINLDGVIGYATSFLEEAFGGLARKYGKTIVNNRLEFISNDEPLLIEEIRDYIRHCDEKK